MNVLVIDTSCWIDYLGGTALPDIDLALREGRAYLSPVVCAELMSARLRPREREELGAFLQELPLCSVDFEHWVRVGDLRSRCGQKGVNISTPDAHVAQCALDLEGYLLTKDRIFQSISRIVSLKTI